MQQIMRQWPQFILYKLITSKKKPGKMDKIPVAPFDRSHDTNGINSQRAGWWVDIDTAQAQANKLGDSYGVAFVITDNDPFFLLDIDNCNEGGKWSTLAQDLMGRLAGAYIEVSQSGNGLHIMGQTAPLDHRCRNEALGIELYTSGRFVALTGNAAVGNIEQMCTAQLQGIITQYLGESVKFDDADWTSEPRHDWMGYTDDADLIARALESASTASAFGNKATFRDLWEADADALQAAYPDGDRDYNASQADAALAQHLAFWTGNNCDRIRDLMEQSALKRDKWDEENHASYLRRTILKAVAGQNDVHRLKQLTPEAAEPTATLSSHTPQTVAVNEPELVSGFQYLPVDQQLKHFKGCVYVQNAHAVLTPDGELLKPEQFRATYGGYLFALDANNDKQTKNAWEAFVESQAIRHPKVHRVWFKPQQPFGQITLQDGLRYVNCYVPVQTLRQPGDIQPFYDHLTKLLPVKADRDIILAYMAAVVQFPGHKFQWAPLIQGVEGNGKTLLSRCVSFAVGRRYTHHPDADDLANKFNEWLLNKIFIAIEDIYVPDHKREVIEKLKPMITGGDGLQIQGKGKDQVDADVCANFMFNSNHKDAIKKTRNDRRFAVFFTAQQTEEDVKRDMPPGYFPKIYDWLRNGGYAAVNEFLQTYQIPVELNPALESGGMADRAPQTSATEQAVAASLGRVEQEVLEAIDERRPGFAGGWVSSKALDMLLEETNSANRIPRNKRRDMMQQLGYDYHPALSGTNGRVTTTTNTDGNKPRLYVKLGHLNCNLTTQADIVAAYDKAQTESASVQEDPTVRGAFNR